MVIDRLIEEIIQKKNPCIVGIDPVWTKIPDCYRRFPAPEGIMYWAKDVIDAVADIVPAVKPQMAFFEMYGADGIRVHGELVRYARRKGLLVIDDSKRGDIGSTAAAYAYAHLASDGSIDADFMTVNPFLGTDSIQPFLDTARQDEKGIFILVKTSNPGSAALSGAVNSSGKSVCGWLSEFVKTAGMAYIGSHGYSSIGAVVGATWPEEAVQCRQIMKHAFFLVPGFGAQGGQAEDCIPCFQPDGLGAVVSSSRSVLYAHENTEDAEDCNRSSSRYQELVRREAVQMRISMYTALQERFPDMLY